MNRNFSSFEKISTSNTVENQFENFERQYAEMDKSDDECELEIYEKG